MTARPIRRNAQTPDRNGKIFYTSTTSLSHISKVPGDEAAHGRGRYHRAGHDADPPAVLSVLRAAYGYSHRLDHGLSQGSID